MDSAADQQALIDALGWTLLAFCWQALLVLLAYLAARRLLGPGKLRARLLAGYAAMLALAVLPTITLLRQLATVTDAPAIGTSSAAHAVDGVVAAPWLAWLVAGWAAGVLLLAARGVHEWWQLQHVCRLARPVAGDWQQRLERLATAFGTTRPMLLESARVGGPMLVGWLKPVILLPAGLCLRLPADQLELVLAHELAHVRRWDYLANLLQVVVETVLFFHPAVHWISRRVREDRELCCDDLVADVCHSPLAYARALLAVAEQQSGLPRLAVAAGGGQLLARIERIVGQATTRPEPVPRRLAALLAPVAAALLSLPVGTADAPTALAPIHLPELQRSVVAVTPMLPNDTHPIRLSPAAVPPPALPPSALPVAPPTRHAIRPPLPGLALQLPPTMADLPAPGVDAVRRFASEALASTAVIDTGPSQVCRRHAATGSRFQTVRCTAIEHADLEREQAQRSLRRMQLATRL